VNGARISGIEGFPICLTRHLNHDTASRRPRGAGIAKWDARHRPDWSVSGGRFLRTPRGSARPLAIGQWIQCGRQVPPATTAQRV